MIPSCSPSSPINRTSLSLICSLIINSLIVVHPHHRILHVCFLCIKKVDRIFYPPSKASHRTLLPPHIRSLCYKPGSLARAEVRWIPTFLRCSHNFYYYTMNPRESQALFRGFFTFFFQSRTLKSQTEYSLHAAFCLLFQDIWNVVHRVCSALLAPSPAMPIFAAAQWRLSL